MPVVVTEVNALRGSGRQHNHLMVQPWTGMHCPLVPCLSPWPRLCTGAKHAEQPGQKRNCHYWCVCPMKAWREDKWAKATHTHALCLDRAHTPCSRQQQSATSGHLVSFSWLGSIWVQEPAQSYCFLTRSLPCLNAGNLRTYTWLPEKNLKLNQSNCEYINQSHPHS